MRIIASPLNVITAVQSSQATDGLEITDFYVMEMINRAIIASKCLR
jgi:hypothetical protein